MLQPSSGFPPLKANCSQDLAIETIELLLQSKGDETEKRLGQAQILQLLKLCLRIYFTFNGTIYEQLKGTPMGSPMSGFIAKAVLQRSSLPLIDTLTPRDRSYATRNSCMAEKRVGQEETVLCADFQKEETVFVAAANFAEAQLFLPGSVVCPVADMEVPEDN
nr:unnamed protein product [Spirometra erinaceieuropaei]